MDAPYRALFNAGYSDELYRRYLADFFQRCHCPTDMQIAETPVFLPADLRERCERAGAEILAHLSDPKRIEQMRAAIPGRWNTPGETALPTFAIIDFAVTEDENGRLTPKLIELQGFPTLIAYETMQRDAWNAALQTIPGLDFEWTCWFSGLSRPAFLQLAESVILGDKHPQSVVLMDIDPPAQKTYPDFTATKALFGVDSVCPTQLVKEGRRLFRIADDGKKIPVERIYNRVIFDEIERKGIELPWDFRDELDVEWTPHPNWFWTWSKYSLPFLDHPAAPRATLLSHLDDLPANVTEGFVTEHYVLKPLFSFAGAGVNVAPTAEDVAAIPRDQRSGWCLQEKIEYAPALQAADGGSGVKVELRMIYLRPDDAPQFTLAQNLCRLSRGAMMGVDHNKKHRWVGSSIGLWPSGER
ncbi:MAG: hypothetical protein JOY98_14990 [Candidatus Eremiobacteraeota bacterium]|nr:hypothetical protein [Candidatus Eremiobacteraeota bacterium]